jgi:hypothetical protein
LKMHRAVKNAPLRGISKGRVQSYRAVTSECVMA